MLSVGFDTCIKMNSPLVNHLINDTFPECLTFQSKAGSHLISWFSVFNFTMNIKQLYAKNYHSMA